MRQSGILMHITSLPGPYGIGTMGKAAYDFVDFLKKSGQSLWQLLPVTPTGFGDSPYQSCSAYAGNHYLIDLDLLIQDGLLQKQEVISIQWSTTADRVDFGKLYEHRLALLRKAFRRFAGGADFETFCRENTQWLPDFALFMALKDLHGGKPWYLWEEGCKFRKTQALSEARKALREEIRFYCFVQYLFDRQWQALCRYAHDSGVQIVGDVPIYVPLDSCEVWTEPELFMLDENRIPTQVAGCPPDGFNEDGQLWGNPLYRWDVHAKDDYRWWIRRMAAAGKRYDIVRIDHFRGLESYWAVPFGDQTARNGQWVKGPGLDFVRSLRRQLPQTQMIAEDLGFMTDEVIALRDASGYPGMKVLLFAFDSREPSEYLPYQYPFHCVCYTGTHDNMTSRQWYETAEPEAASYAAAYINLAPGEAFSWGMIRTAMASPSDICMIPMQDYLDLDAHGRMNLPGTCTSQNWTWRAENGFISPDLAGKILRLTKLYGRDNAKKTG